MIEKDDRFRAKTSLDVAVQQPEQLNTLSPQLASDLNRSFAHESIMVTGDSRAVLRVGYLGGGREKFVDRMDKLFGEGSWTIGYIVEGKPITRDDALILYQKSYTNFLKANPEFTERLLREA